MTIAGDNYKIDAESRLLLYATAIQTGLRAAQNAGFTVPNARTRLRGAGSPCTWAATRTTSRR